MFNFLGIEFTLVISYNFSHAMAFVIYVVSRLNYNKKEGVLHFYIQFSTTKAMKNPTIR